ncbi:DUF2970 domain-containing protein [Aliidiomarina soli]|uniref:DUF2970 domain-containing protein n=1 Tax=Aliidiomarina soli TaxID=1928574 RepID=A0A432WG04_9GAMM|nr:DUF2970 domain-containing protein [Aliidiomarina soli]RUO32647.1 hypothetical protein CWE14_10575 [Aliidiomarina soli]
MTNKESTDKQSTDKESASSQKVTFWQVCKSVAAALLGVQSEQARARDFAQSNPLPYIAVGAIAIVGCVILMALLVRTIISVAS